MDLRHAGRQITGYDRARDPIAPNGSAPDPRRPPCGGAAAKIGILLANLGTPDNYDYWSMRRYLSEFFSDKRVIDYSAWLWQPLAAACDPDQAAVFLGRGLSVDLEQ